MLRLVTGDQGAGKTLKVVRAVIREVDLKRPAAQIYANLEVDHPNAHRMTWAELTDPEAPPGIYIWDEAPRFLESRRSSSLPMSRLQSTTEERKHARDVWMTAQMVGQIDVRVRVMCKTVQVLKPKFVTKRRYDRDTDEIIRREHPRFVVMSTWKGSDTLRPVLRKEDRLTRSIVPWRVLAPYIDRYDTTESIAVAGHLAGGKDHYRDEKENADAVLAQQGTVRSAGRAPRPRRSPEPATDPAPVEAGRVRSPGAARRPRVARGT